MVTDDGVLFVEPQLPPAAQPVLDRLLFRLTAAWRKSTRSTYAYKGFHICSCGAPSDNVDHYLPRGEKTNSLCIHYLAYHRHELTPLNLQSVESALVGFTDEAAPTEDELSVPYRLRSKGLS